MTNILSIAIQARLPLLPHTSSRIDYIPLVSTVENLGLLALKTVALLFSFVSHSHTWLNRFAHLNVSRSLLLLIPCVGNFLVYRMDQTTLKDLIPLTLQNTYDGSPLDTLHKHLFVASYLDTQNAWPTQWVSKERDNQGREHLLQDIIRILRTNPKQAELLGALSLLTVNASQSQQQDLLQETGYASLRDLALEAIKLNPTEASVFSTAAGIFAKEIPQEEQFPYPSFGASTTDPVLFCLTRAVTLNPHHAPYWHDLGKALEERSLDITVSDQVVGPKECYNRAVTLNPKTGQYWGDLGRALLPLPYAEQETIISGGSVTCYQKATALDPKSSDYWKGLGQALQPLQANKVYDYFIQAIEINPNDADNWTKLGKELLSLGIIPASLQVNGKQICAAYECFVKAIELSPDDVDNWRNLGKALSSLTTDPGYPLTIHGHLIHSACDCYAHATELLPRNPILWGELGMAIEQSSPNSPPCLDSNQQVISPQHCYVKAIDLSRSQANNMRRFANSISSSNISSVATMPGEKKWDPAKIQALATQRDHDQAISWHRLGHLLKASPQTITVNGARISYPYECFSRASALAPHDSHFREEMKNNPIRFFHRIARLDKRQAFSALLLLATFTVSVAGPALRWTAHSLQKQGT